MVDKGTNAFADFPEAIKHNQEAIAETIENNVRKLITDETPTNPRYYQQMSILLEELVKQRKQADIEYQEYLKKIIELSKQVRDPGESVQYPDDIDTNGKRALFDNLNSDKVRALAISEAILSSRSDDWRGHPLKERAIKMAIKRVYGEISDDELKALFEIVKNQYEY